MENTAAIPVVASSEKALRRDACKPATHKDDAPAAAWPLAAQRNYPPNPPDARSQVYRSVDGLALRAWIFEPAGHSADDRRPAIVFFFGGGWVGGTPKQFYPHCRDLAELGMVAISAEYRIKSKHGTTPMACVEDGKSAVRYLRANANQLGIDPDRIVSGGGSAGGHVAACTGVLEGYEAEAEDRSAPPHHGDEAAPRVDATRSVALPG